MAESLSSKHATRFYVPDFFRGQPFPMAKDGDKEELGKFFSGV